MTGEKLTGRWGHILGRPGLPDTRAMDAARLMIEGDVDGAFVAAEQLRNVRNNVIRRDGYAVLAWVHLVRGERDRAEAAASLSRIARAPDGLLTIALVVASGGPSVGAATALTETTGVLSLVGATRVFADHRRLDDVRAEIAKLPPKREQAALETLRIGLVAEGRQPDIDEVTGRLTELGMTPRRDAIFASKLAKLGLTELSRRYLQLFADRGLADLENVPNDPDVVDARDRPAIAAVRDEVVADAASTDANTRS